MSGPEQATTVTPGQAAYEAWHGPDVNNCCPWAELPERDQRDWHRAAAAAAARKPGSERVAELVTEGNELRRERDRLADELQKAEATIADYRDALCAMQAERDKLQREPAVVTAGTEHLTDQITRRVIPDEES